MKILLYKVCVVTCFLLSTLIIHAQTPTSITYTFKIEIKDPSLITETKPTWLYSNINTTTHTTELPAGSKDLVRFEQAGNPSLGSVSIHYGQNSGQLFLVFVPYADGLAKNKTVYNLSYTKARLKYGNNILKVQIENDLIFITCNSGTVASQLIETNQSGDGMLRYNDIGLFTEANRIIASHNSSELLTTQLDYATSTNRFLITTTGDDYIYYEYGYDDNTQAEQLGNALSFDGVNDHVAMPPNVYFNSNFTIEAMVYPRSFNAWSRVLDFGNGAGVNNVILALTDGTSGYPVFRIEGSQFQSNTPLLLNQWNHIAATLNGTTATIYINGNIAGTATLQVPVNVVRNYCYIGRSNWAGDGYANAIMDEVRIWNIARSQADIQASMNDELDGTETGLVAYFNCNQGVACGDNAGVSSLLNVVTGANNGTLTNFGLSGATSNWVPGFIPNSTASICVGATILLNNVNDGGVWASSNSNIATVDATTGNVTAISAGNVNITYTYSNVNSCSSTATTLVTVNALPTLASISGTKSLCGVISTTQLSNSISNGIWLSNNANIATVSNTGLVTGITSGTATINYLVVNASGCSASTSTIVTVGVASIPKNTGNALNFDGIDDYVSFADLPIFNITNAITVEAWVKVNAFDKNWQAIITKGDNSWRLQRSDDNNTVEFATSGTSPYSLSGVTNINDGQWHHIAGVYDGTKKYIYVDGNLDASINTSGTIAVTIAPVHLGANSQQVNRNFNGTMDEVRIWTVARTQAQIQAALNTELIGNETGLLANYNFNQNYEQCYGCTSLKDKTSNANNGILTNFALSGTTSNWVAGTVATTSASFCPNDIIKLNNTNTNGVWSSSNTSVATVDNNGLVIIPSAGTATISYTAKIGCFVSATTVVTAYGYPSTPTITASATTICPSNPVTLSTNQLAGYTYKWSTTANGSSIGNSATLTVNPTVTTNYYVTVSYTTPPSNTGGICTFSATSSAFTITVNTLTITNNAANAVNFDGSNDYINISRVIQDDFSIEFWMKTTQTGPTGSQWYNGYGLVDAEVSGVKNDFGLSLIGSKVAFGVGNPDNTIFSTSNVNAGNWIHVAATRSKTTGLMQLFINGVLEASYTSSNRNSLTAPANIALGRLQTGIQYFNGSLDDIRLWSTVLTQSQIQAALNTELVGTEANLVNYYKCDQGIAYGNNSSITTLIDKTTNANNGTLTNFAKTGTTSNWVVGSEAVTSVKLYNDNPIQLSNATAGGTWSSGNTGVVTVNSTGTITPISSGTANINYIYSNTNGCIVTATSSISVSGTVPQGFSYSPTLAIFQVNASPSTILIYPNPAHDKVTVQLAVGMEKATVTIISALGATIATDNNTGLQRIINLFGKPSGTYLVKITTKDGVNTTQKLIMQ